MPGHVFGRHTTANPPTVVRGEGCYLFAEDGQRVFDGSGGAAVSCLGHGDREVTEAIKKQLDHVAYAHTSFFTSEPAEALADLLAEHAPGDLARVYFVSGGSEAIEAALKLARQYCVEIGETERRHVVARRQSYHGNTLGALATGGNAWRRQQFAPLLVETTHVSPCFEYRDCCENETPKAYGQRLARELDETIERLGPQSVMAFVAEPVVGATLGAVPAVPGYFRAVREVCDRHGVLLILDEVMCGMGRTGHLFACEADGVAPDIAAIAKGLGAGYQPIGAMLCTGTIFDAIRGGSGFFQHGHTYLAHPTACAAALAVTRAILDRGLVPRVRAMGDALDQALRARFADHPHVGDIRGRGLFRGIEIVADRATKTPFDPALTVHKTIKRTAFAHGLACYPMGGTIDGRRGDHVLLAPPFVMEEAQIEEIVEPLATAIDAATRGAAAQAA